MKRILSHTLRQPFIFSTGLAALVHSTWSVSTLFTGIEPYPQFSAAWFAWVLPGFLIAFSLDVGQIVTSAEIRDGSRSLAKFATFGIFAIATWYLQFLYIAHHMPALNLAEGVAHVALATTLRDLGLWVLPLLLPLSTLLYTFSHTDALTLQVQPEEDEAEEEVTEELPIPLFERLAAPENGTALADAEKS